MSAKDLGTVDLAEVEHRVRTCLAEIGKEGTFISVYVDPADGLRVWRDGGGLSLEERWKVAQTANYDPATLRCLACFSFYGCAPFDEWSCEAFGRRGLRDCGVPR